MDDSAGEDTDQIRHGSGRRILPDLTGLDLLGSGVLVLDVEGRVFTIPVTEFTKDFASGVIITTTTLNFIF